MIGLPENKNARSNFHQSQRSSIASGPFSKRSTIKRNGFISKFATGRISDLSRRKSSTRHNVNFIF